MLSHLELRHVMEVAFQPMICTCTITSGGSMTVELKNPGTYQKVLTVADISIARLSGGRAIAALVGEIKEEVRQAQAGTRSEVKKHG